MNKNIVGSLFLSLIITLTSCGNKNQSNENSFIESNPVVTSSESYIISDTPASIELEEDFAYNTFKNLAASKQLNLSTNGTSITYMQDIAKITLGNITVGLNSNNKVEILVDIDLVYSSSNIDTRYSLTGTYKDGAIYAKSNNTPISYLYIPLEDIASSSLANIDYAEALQYARPIYDYIFNDVMPFIDGFITYYKSDVNTILEALMKKLFSFTKYDENNYLLAFNPQGLVEMLKSINDTTIAAYTDYLLGPGSFVLYSARLLLLSLRKTGVYIDALKASGADLLNLLKSTDNLIKSLSNDKANLQSYTKKDVIGMLESDEYRNKSVFSFIAELFDITVDQIVDKIKNGAKNDNTGTVIEEDKLKEVEEFAKKYLNISLIDSTSGQVSKISYCFNENINDDISFETHLDATPSNNYIVNTSTVNNEINSFIGNIKLTKEELINAELISSDLLASATIDSNGVVISYTEEGIVYNLSNIAYYYSINEDGNYLVTGYYLANYYDSISFDSINVPAEKMIKSIRFIYNPINNSIKKVVN